MDVSSMESALSNLSQANASQRVDMAVLKKALDAGAQASLDLIAALPPMQSLPPNLGNIINTVA